MLLVVALACVAAALMIALVSLSPRRERLRVPRRTMVGLDRRRHQVQRRMRVTEALAHHERRLSQQRSEQHLALAITQSPLPKTEWTRPDPAMGVRRGLSLPMQPVAPYWQNWLASSDPSMGFSAPSTPPFFVEPARAS
jgi:hypothetical protein